MKQIPGANRISICMLALCVTLFWPAVLSAQNPFAGSWKTKTFKPGLGTAITYSRSAAGTEHFSNNGNREYDFAIDGKEYPTDRPASTVSWNKLGPSAWECTEKIRERVMRKIRLTLSSDGQTLTTTYTWFDPGNRTAQGSTTYRRIAGGPGLEGTWKPVERVEEPDTATFAFPVPGQMYFYVDPDGTTWAGPTDGTFMALQGPMRPPGQTSAFKVVNPRKMTMEIKVGDKTSSMGTWEVSEDGKTLTRSSWAPGKEDQKNTLVLDKQ